jgi:HTH-type transcriptional regulator, sugar sensing transcriptional regulator
MKEKLEKLGFSTKEADVYLALLELGSAIVSDVAKRSGKNRSTTYVLLESLAEKGFVSISEKNNVKLFSVTPPERLVQYMQDLVKKHTELVGLAHNLLPELKSLYVGIGPKPRVQFFEGTEGLKTAYEDTLTSKETIRAYASIENMHKALPDYFPEYYNRRAKQNIAIRAIFPDTPASQERIKHNKTEARESLLVPSAKYAFSPEINIYDNKIVFMSLAEKFSLIIESQELSDALKKVFELSWAEAKRLNKMHDNKNK